LPPHTEMRWRVLGVALCHLSPPPSLAFHARACLSRGRAATSAGHAATRLDAVATAVHQPDVPYSTSVEGDGQSTWAENFELDSQGKVIIPRDMITPTPNQFVSYMIIKGPGLPVASNRIQELWCQVPAKCVGLR